MSQKWSIKTELITVHLQNPNYGKIRDNPNKQRRKN